MKKAIVIIALCFGFFFLTHRVMAADANFTCTSSGCTPSSVTGFFPSSEVWYPGKTLVKTIQVANNGAEPLDIKVNAQNYTQPAGIDEAVQFDISRSGTPLWDGSLYSFYRTSPVLLQTGLAGGATQTFTFTAFMYEDAGNAYQGKSTQFDMALNFTSGSSSSSSCSAKEPNVPGPLSIQKTSDTEVKASWGTVSDPVTGYRITWSKGTDTDGEGEGSKSVGKTSQINIGGLELDKYGYYFKIRSVNDCVESQPTAIVFAGKGPDLRSTTDVLGASTSSSSSTGLRGFNAPVQGQVRGASSSRDYSKQPGTLTADEGQVAGETTTCRCIWWQILLTELIVTLIYFWITKDTDPRVHSLAAVFEVFGGFAFFRSVNACLGFAFLFIADAASPFCRYFFFLNAVAVALAFLIRKRMASKSDLPSE